MHRPHLRPWPCRGRRRSAEEFRQYQGGGTRMRAIRSGDPREMGRRDWLRTATAGLAGQAAAAGIPQVLTFGHTSGGNRKLWVERFRQLGPAARDHGVTIVVKQHGGETGTGAACASIVREVGDAGIMVNYDAGNVMDYL